MQASPVVSKSPSFTCTNLSEIAARVVEEFQAENETDSEFSFNEKNKYENDEYQVNENQDDDFEFAFVTEGSDKFSPISADEIFYNGQIRPFFNGDLLSKDIEFKCCCKSEKVSTRVSLRKLFFEDGEIASENDDLERITPGTYCVWRPRSAEESPSELCKKSNSTGSISSKRWKLLDFLHRSNSEGKETFVFLTTPFKKREEKAVKMTRTDSAKVTGKVAGVEGFPAVHCSKNGKDKRKSYLPYRQDLVSFFGNVNGLNLH